MAEYNLLKDGYHPGKVSFEVEALLLDEAKESTLCSTFTGLVETDGEGYDRSKERSFDPLTDEKTVDEYINYEHERDMVYGHLVDKLEEQRREGKRFKSWKTGAALAALSIKKRFSAVIQSMLLNAYVTNQIEAGKQSKEKGLEVNIKETDKVLHSRELSSFANSKTPHVDALRHERAHVRYI